MTSIFFLKIQIDTKKIVLEDCTNTFLDNFVKRHNFFN